MKELPTGVQSDQAKKKIDWERIEADYRAGFFSVREIAAKNKISHTLINRKAKDLGWERDLNAKIKAKADSIVAKTFVADDVSNESKVSSLETDEQIIEVNAQALALVKMRQRGLSAKFMRVFECLLDEIECVTVNQQPLQQLAETIFNSPDDDSTGGEESQSSWQAKRIEMFNRSMGMAGRIDSFKKLMEAGDRALSTQDRIWGLAQDGNKPKTPSPNDHSFECTDKEWDDFQSALKH